MTIKDNKQLTYKIIALLSWTVLSAFLLSWDWYSFRQTIIELTIDNEIMLAHRHGLVDIWVYLLIWLAGVIFILWAVNLVGRTLQRNQAHRRQLENTIAEYKLAEEALRESEKLFETTIIQSPIPMVITDANQDIVLYNNKFIELFGYTLDDVSTAEAWWLVAYPDEEYRQTVQDSWAKAIGLASERGGEIEMQEWDITAKDGSVHQVEFKMTLLGDISLIVMNDITERKQADRILRESEKKYRTIINESPIGIFYYDLNGIITECNQKFTEIIGSSRDALIGLDMPNQLKDKTMVKAVLQSLEKGEAHYEDLYLSVTADKQTYLSVILKGIRDDNNKITDGLGLVEDITQRKEVENALRGSEKKYRDVIDNSPDLLYRTDKAGKIMFISPSVLRLTGYSQAESVGMTISGKFYAHPKDRKMLIAALHRDGYIENFEVKLKRKNGSFWWGSTNAHFSTDLDGNIVGVEGITRDITERRRAEQERLKLEKLESLGVLAGGIAHDFNNLLTGLFGNIEMAKMFLATDHKSTRFLETAGRSMEQATGLTQQLLTFAKGGDLIKETFSIGEVIVETAQFSRRGSHVKLQTNVAADLWLVDADKGQLSQVIRNLVINAQQAMPVGGAIIITVENIEDSTGKYVQISVQDEGMGIAPQYLDKIFDPYFSTKQEGSGLGLASSHSIINKHNGTISVTSKLNQGTTFIIRLPATEKLATTIVASQDEAISTSVPSAHILVLDDEELVRDVLEAMLEAMGHSVSCAVDGQEAIDKYRASFDDGTPYDVVITDLTIPGGMGGKEAGREILKIDPHAKIIVSSGYATDPVMAHYESYGFYGIAVKPYRFVDMQSVIGRVLNMT